MRRPQETAASLLQRHWLTALVGIILLGFGLRVARLDYQALWLDELYTLYQASFPLSQLWHQLTSDPINFDQTPLYYVLLAFWVRLAGGSEFAIRFASVAAGVLSLPAQYVLLHLRLNRFQSLVGTGILSVAAFAIYFSQEARMHILALLLGVLGAYALLKALAGGALKWWVAYVLIAAAELYTFYYASLVLLAINLPVLLSRNGRSWRWAVSNLGALLLWLPWLLLAVVRARALLGHRTQDLSAPTLSDYLGQVTSSLAYGATLAPAFAVPLSMILLGAALLACWKVSCTRTMWDRIVVAYAFVPLLSVFLLTQRIPVFYPRYLLAALPGWIGVAVAGWPFWPRLRWLTPVLGGLIFLAPTGISLANNYANPEYERIDYRPAIDLIRQEALPGEAIIYDSPNAATRGGHYLYEQPLPAIALPPPVNKAATIAELERLTIEHDGLWVLLYGQLDIDRDNTVETWLDRNELPILDRSFGANWYRLKHYRAAPIALENALLPGGFSVDRTAGPLRLVQARVAPLAPAIMVDLLWAIDRSAGGDYVVSLQLLAEDRHKVAQMDSEPFLGGYSTSQWKPGLAYSDSVQLKPGPVAPGAYALLLAVYPAGKPEQSQQLELGGYELGHAEFMPRGT